MVIGTRLTDYEEGAFRAGHSFGNWLFIFLVRVLFGVRTRDLFSGYRVITRRFLEATPLIAQGFEVEAELSLQAVVQRFPVAEVPVRYRARPKENPSKLHTYRDGYRILLAILTFFRDYRPMTCFGLLALFFLAAVARRRRRGGRRVPGDRAGAAAAAGGALGGPLPARRPLVRLRGAAVHDQPPLGRDRGADSLEVGSSLKILLVYETVYPDFIGGVETATTSWRRRSAGAGTR